MARRRKNTTGIPDFEIDSLARALLPAIQKLFETEEGKREFETWKAERQQKQLNNKDNEKKSPIESQRTAIYNGTRKSAKVCAVEIESE